MFGKIASYVNKVNHESKRPPASAGSTRLGSRESLKKYAPDPELATALENPVTSGGTPCGSA